MLSRDKEKTPNSRTWRNIVEYLMLHRLVVLLLADVAALIVMGLAAYSLGLLPGDDRIIERLRQLAEAGRCLVR